ncbi:HxlR family transcriptional regulator [Staphylococcus aureus]|nr:MarR family transcriptional regulator [Staphylococcus aureus]PZK04418.1 HxlR family transcriptional regulator [Staphylococcus aureus]
MLITTIFDKNGSDNNNIVNRLTNDKVNNKFLSEMLNVSKPAITKSIKKLLAKGLVVESHNEFNKREVNYSLTQEGKKLSYIHDELHEEAVKKYEEVLKVFDNDEMAVIVEFLNRSIEELKKEEDGLND